MADGADQTQPKIETQPGFRLSFVWLVPLAAALIGGAVAWRAYDELGPLVEIRFAEAAGVRADKTQVRYKDVIVGAVEEVTLTDDLEEVIVRARLDKVMAPFLGDTTRFWIVSARVDGFQVSGLDTLLSGSFIEVDWTEPPTELQSRFVGLTNAPLTDAGAQGGRLTLRADNAGSLDVGSKIYYRQLPVGRIESRELKPDGVHFEAFIDAPYHREVTENTLFWNVSGFEVRAGADGLVVDFESLDSVLAGGVAFGVVETEETLVIAAPGVGDYASADARRDAPIDWSQLQGPVTLHNNQQDARESLIEDENPEPYRFIAIFQESMSGLSPGAPVELSGIRVGEVIDVKFEAGTVYNEAPRLFAIIEFQSRRIRRDGLSPASLARRLRRGVKDGLRLQMESGNLLTGSRMLRLVQLPDAEPASIDFSAQPYPSFPTAPSEIAALSESATAMMRRIAQLPLEDLGEAAVGLIRSAEALLADPALQDAPEELQALLIALGSAAKGVEDLVADPALQATPEELQALLSTASSATEGLNTLLADPALKDAPAELTALLQALSAATENVDALLDDPATQQMPAELVAFLQAFTVTARSIDAASRDLPQLVSNLNRMSSGAELALEGLSPDSELYGELAAAARDLGAAAQSVDDLARTLEQNPSALITGR